MTALILGCGYLGRRVGLALLREGEAVFGTTRSPQRAAELEALGIRPVLVDVLRPEAGAPLPAAERVLCCVGYDRTAGVPIRRVYVEGVDAILARLGDGLQRFVYASSTSVYGRDDGGWVDESSLPGPRTESGRACLEAENRVQSRIYDRGAEVIHLRFAGLYGPGRIIRRAALERGEPIAGDPDRYLNLIHIEDAAIVARLALTRPKLGVRYAVADDRPVPRREYYELAATLLGAPAPHFVPLDSESAGAAREEANRRVANRAMKSDLVETLLYPDITTGVPAALEAERLGVAT